MKLFVNIKRLFFTLTLFFIFTLSTGFTQPVQAGTRLSATTRNCDTFQTVTNGLSTIAGYFGTIGANPSPRAGDIAYVLLEIRVLGRPCNFFDTVYTELVLPTGAEVAISNATPMQCFMDGANVSNSNEFSCRVFNEATTFGGIVLGTNFIFPGQVFEIQVPVRFSTALNNASLRFFVQSVEVDSFRGAISPLQPEKRITVPSAPVTTSVTYPNPSTTSITTTSARLNAIVTNNFNAGNVFYDFGTTTAYGTTSAAIPITAANAASNVTLPFNNLTPNTLFHWRARFVLGGQTFTGADQTFTTLASPSSFRLTVNKNGNATGFVSDSTGIIVCGNTCSSSFRADSSVTLIAQTPISAVFAGWGGACASAGINTTCQVLMTSDQTVTATFNQDALDTGSLAINISGLPADVDADVIVTTSSGTTQNVDETTTLNTLVPGTYTVTASSITNGSDVFTPSPASQTVTVTSGNTSSVAITFTQDAPNPIDTGSLTVNVSGLSDPALVQVVKDGVFIDDVASTKTLDNLEPGTYRIKVFPVLIDGTIFLGTVDNPSVTLTSGTLASVNISYAASTGPVVSLTRNLKITVSESAGSDGKVTTSPVSNECGSGDCSFGFDTGLFITLTANKGVNTIFTGWGGDCETAGTAPTCILPIENRIGFSEEVTASFSSGSDLAITLGEENPEQLSLIGNLGNTLFQVSAKATRDVQVKSLSVSVTGTGDDVADITAVKLVLDTNANGKKDANEVEVASGKFTEDNGTLTLETIVPVVIPAGETSTLLVTWDVDPSVLEAIAGLLPLTLLGLGLTRKKTLLALFFASSLLLTSCLQTPNPAPQASTYTFSLNSMNAELTTGGEALVEGVPLATRTLEVPR